MNNFSPFKKRISRVFDDTLKTEQWKNYVDYAIISLIVISTLQIFLSSYEAIEKEYYQLLHAVDLITTLLFTVEIILRIWTVGEVDPKYKGFRGKVRYCFSFYGLIDLVSTVPFYIYLFFPIPYSLFKIFRIARLLRVFRYMESFNLLIDAFKSKSAELWVSIQFLTIITLILSFILYVVEHEIQPTAYSNGMDSVIWAFTQYIGDPGGFAESPPITFVGRVVASLIGILGIAIFAVPAGLIGSGFIETIERRRREKKNREHLRRMRFSFRSVQCRLTLFQIVPKYVSIVDIQAKQQISEQDILEAVEVSTNFRLRNIATTVPIERNPIDKLVVEHFPLNRSYGCCINRGSSVTIVATSSVNEAALGSFSYYLAKMGRFNYVSKEIDPNPDTAVSYYNISDESSCPNLSEFLSDIKSMSQRKTDWVVFLLSASGGTEPIRPTNVHYITGAPKGDSELVSDQVTINDKALFRQMSSELSDLLSTEYSYLSDINQYYGCSIKNIARNIRSKNNPNAFTLRLSFDLTCRDYRSTEIAKNIANSFCKHFESNNPKKLLFEQMKNREFGFEEGSLFSPNRERGFSLQPQR